MKRQQRREKKMGDQNSSPQEKRATKVYNKVLNYFMGIALYSMVAFVFINGVMRYVFNTGWPASEELSRFLFVWISMLGAIVAYREGKHVGVDLLINALRPKAKRIVMLIGEAVAITILGIVLYGGLKYYAVIYKTPAPATGIPMGILAIALIVCMVSMLGYTVSGFIKLLKQAEEPKEVL
ncbi:MAG: TRAP transporter small permease [Anaerovoracaceae bacterium]